MFCGINLRPSARSSTVERWRREISFVVKVWTAISTATCGWHLAWRCSLGIDVKSNILIVPIISDTRRLNTRHWSFRICRRGVCFGFCRIFAYANFRFQLLVSHVGIVESPIVPRKLVMILLVQALLVQCGEIDVRQILCHFGVFFCFVFRLSCFSASNCATTRQQKRSR